MCLVTVCSINNRERFLSECLLEDFFLFFLPVVTSTFRNMTVILFKETSNKPTVAHITFDSERSGDTGIF